MELKHKRNVAIIPARGGSKGIPRKNIRLLGNKPLIAYSIETALRSKYIDDVVVTTDDDEIAEISRLFGAKVIKRPKELAEDQVPLDPVIYHALTSIEDEDHQQFEAVATIQPTSPLLSTETLDTMIDMMYRENYDTILSVKAEPHLFWIKSGEQFLPLYVERKSRQYLEPIYQETGAVVVSKRSVISEKSRIGNSFTIFEVPQNEAIDIDTYQDWESAENILHRKTIVFIVDGDYDIGLGHVYRALTLANRFVFRHNIVFLMNGERKLGIQKVQEFLYSIKTYSNEDDMAYLLDDIGPDIIINDILDTDPEYIQSLRKKGYFVVNFEDLGEGAEYANIDINALHENSYPPENHYYGYRYECLRDEFYIFPPKKPVPDVNSILITFGGTDPNDLTSRALEALEKLDLTTIAINVILGKGYRPKEKLYAYVSQLQKKGFHIDVKENVRLMAKEMGEADIVLTSNGRTIYEVASVGTPCISISQNEREVRHLFVHNSHGPLSLGLAYTLLTDDIASAIKRLIDDYPLRKEMNKKLLKFDLKGNLERVLNLILNSHEEWKRNDNN